MPTPEFFSIKKPNQPPKKVGQEIKPRAEKPQPSEEEKQKRLLAIQEEVAAIRKRKEQAGGKPLPDTLELIKRGERMGRRKFKKNDRRV